MSEEVALLTEILENPAADDCRCIYADWLEERGDRRAAAFRLALEVWRLARKARTPPFGEGDVHVARRRLKQGPAPHGVDLALLWSCSCVRFLPMPDGRILTAVLPLALQRWLTIRELQACGLDAPAQACPDLCPSREEVVADELSRDAVEFVLGTGLGWFLTDRGMLAFLLADCLEITDTRQRDAVARRQIKHARKWCFGFGQRLLKLQPSAQTGGR